jgi:hypothetical protein
MIFQPREMVQWDGRDNNGSVVSGGVYIFFLEDRANIHRGTLTVLK